MKKFSHFVHIVSIFVLLTKITLAVAPAVTVGRHKTVSSGSSRSAVGTTDGRRNVGDGNEVRSTEKDEDDDDEIRTPKVSSTKLHETTYNDIYAAATDEEKTAVPDASEPALAVATSLQSLSTASRKPNNVLRIAAESKKEEIVDNKNPIDVIELTSKKFSSSIADGNIWLIEFYSPKCGHCVQFESTYSEVASYFHSRNYTADRLNGYSSTKQMKKYTKLVKVARVNGIVERSLLTRFGIDSVPQFFILNGWTVYEYNQHPRSKEAIITYIEEQFLFGDHTAIEAVPFLGSPMGPLGQLHGVTMCTYFMVEDIFMLFQTQFGLPNVITSMIVFGTCFVSFFIMIVLLALLIPPTSSSRNHIKND